MVDRMSRSKSEAPVRRPAARVNLGNATQVSRELAKRIEQVRDSADLLYSAVEKCDFVAGIDRATRVEQDVNALIELCAKLETDPATSDKYAKIREDVASEINEISTFQYDVTRLAAGCSCKRTSGRELTRY
jgi:hypothetical protein